MKKLLVPFMILMCGGVLADSNEAVRLHNDYVKRIKGVPAFYGTTIVPLSKMQIKVMRPGEYWNQVVKMKEGVRYMFIASADTVRGISPDIDMVLTDMKTRRTLQRTYKVSRDSCVVWFPRKTKRYLISVYYNSGRFLAFVAFRKYKLSD